MAAMVLTEKNAESARARIIPVAPASRAAPIASVNNDAAPFPEPADPLRSRVAVMIGAASGVDTVAV
jgi:hypothetical protein